MEHILGFIGYGEAARHIAAGLRKEGMKEAITAFDVLLSNPERKAEVLERMGQAEVIPKASAVEVAVGTKFIVSVNSAKVAYSIAQEVIPALQAGQVYVELNSASPDLMEKIDQIPRARAFSFVMVQRSAMYRNLDIKYRSVWPAAVQMRLQKR